MASSDRPQSGLQDLDRQAFINSPKRLTPQESARAVVVENTSSEPIPIVSQGLSTTPTIYNVAVGTSEVSQVLSANTKRFSIRLRGNATLQLGYAVSESSTKFITIGPGVDYEEMNLNAPSLTLYFKASKAAQIAEIVEWV